MAITKTVIVDVKTKKAQNEVNDLNKSLDNTSKSNKAISSSALASAKSFTVMGVSINGVSKALKLLKISLVATGIGAIVVAVGSLAAAFTSTQEGADWLTRTLKPLGEVMATLWGVAQDLGKALYKIVSGDFVNGWDDVTKAVDGFGAAMGEAYDRGKQMADLQIELERNEASHIKTLGSLTSQAAKYKAVVDDETKSLDERRKAAAKLTAVNDAIFKLKKHRTEQEIKLLKLATEANDTSYKDKVEIANKEVELNKQIEARENQRREEQRFARRLTGKGDAGTKEIADAVEHATTLGMAVIDANSSIDELDLQNLINHENRKKQIVADAEREKQQLRLQAAMGTLSVMSGLAMSLSDLAEEGSKEAKGFAIAAAVMDTIGSAVASYKSAAAIPYVGFVLGPIAAAAALVAGYANVQSIRNTDYKTGSGGGGASSSPQITAPNFNIVGHSQNNQLADAVAEGINNKPVKAYVVSSEVTTQQALDRRTETSASIG